MEFLIPKQDIILNSECNNVLIKYQIPFEIKNDIIYCQKALRTYLKVHQMVFLHFGQKLTTALPVVRKLLDDLEREIYEINAEQRFLIYRLRKSLEDFYKSLPINNVVIDRDADNTYLRHAFSKYVDDPNYPCEAITVKTRRSFNQWKRKFSLDDPKRLLIDNKNLNNIVPGKAQPTQQNGGGSNISNSQQKQRVSLLKPKSERDLARLSELDQNIEIKNEDDIMFIIDDDKMPSSSNDSNNVNDIMEVDDKTYPDKTDTKTQQDESVVPLKPSPAMNIGRMKLLQALNKAKYQKEAPPSAQPQITASSKVTSTTAAIKTLQKSPEQQKVMPKFVEVSSSSEDSLDGINALSAVEPGKGEIFQINQEMFLRQFGLYTLQHSAYLKQRRSKRRRRNVQFNERKDFHYGNINFAAIDAQTAGFPKEKKKKIFLASPNVSRKSNKRRRSAKDEAASNKTNSKSDRSSTSSPNEKVFCNVCFRTNELSVLSNCKKCKQMYHISCHSKANIKTGSNSIKKICPVCIRAKKSSRSASSEDIGRNRNAISSSNSGQTKVRRSSLIDQCNVLKKKIITAQSRQNSLLKESEIYKTKMSQLFNIVDKIKRQEVESEIGKLKEPDSVVLEIEISDDDDYEDNNTNDVVDSSRKNSPSSSNSPTNSDRGNLQSVILFSSSSNSTEEINQEMIEPQTIINSNKLNKTQELVDSDEEILVIREDSNIIEINDAADEISTHFEMKK